MMKVSIKDIKPNPNNPRLVKDDKFKKLVESVKGFPDMLNVRPIVVNKDMIVLGGNMRLKAMKEAGYKEANIEIVDWTEEQQREFIIKDNIGYGEWDWNVIANEWDTDKLEEWGMNIPSFDSSEEIEDELQIDEEIKTDNQCPKCGYEF
jgi:ParB-like chromosome segregation protein Spo0J